MVIDFFGLTEPDARKRYPAAYQWALERVKPTDAEVKANPRSRSAIMRVAQRTEVAA